MSDKCRIVGPYYPFGDLEWVCVTHGDVVCELNPPWAYGTHESPRSAMRCPIGDPRPGDSPLMYESRR